MIVLPESATGRLALDVASEAARAAGCVLMKRFYGEIQISHKGRANIVTDVDIQAETVILDLLRQEYPLFSVLAEESGQTEGESEYSWIVDPLDGTRNYASGVPHFSVCIALARSGNILLGIIYDPVRDEMFSAEKGKGAFLNGVQIHVSKNDKLAMSLLGFDMGYVDGRAKNAIRMVEALWPGMQGVRIMGSAALGLAYAAAGRLDLYFHHHLAPWDVASGMLLVREANGVVTDRHGNPAILSNESVIAGNAAVHHEFMRVTDGMSWRTM